jgi:tetratricopeptide (TPR) repeat protein
MAMYDELLLRVRALPRRDPDREVEPYIMYKQALIMIEQKRYTEARAVLQDISVEHSRFYDNYPRAQLAKARSFELEGNWDRALTEYRFLIEHYAGTDEALSTYLYLERHFSKDRRPTEAERWYTQGLETFSQMATRDGLPAARALMYQADMYRQRSEWDQAARTLEQLFERFPDTNMGRQAILTAAVVQREKLRQPAVADSLIERYKRSLVDFGEDPSL